MLITLAIIGVVAALTLPTLITKYQKKALEVGLKKSYAALTNALVPLQYEYWGATNGSFGGDVSVELYHDLYENLKIADVEASNNTYNFQRFLNYVSMKDGKMVYNVRDYALNPNPNNVNMIPSCPQHPLKLLQDGSAVGVLYNCGSHWISIDTNGKRGPNAIGHDIFYFGLDIKQKKLIPLGEKIYNWHQVQNQQQYCSKNSKVITGSIMNGVGCTWYALRDVCPDDETKGYWECLP